MRNSSSSFFLISLHLISFSLPFWLLFSLGLVKRLVNLLYLARIEAFPALCKGNEYDYNFQLWLLRHCDLLKS